MVRRAGNKNRYRLQQLLLLPRVRTWASSCLSFQLLPNGWQDHHLPIYPSIQFLFTVPTTMYVCMYMYMYVHTCTCLGVRDIVEGKAGKLFYSSSKGNTFICVCLCVYMWVCTCVRVYSEARREPWIPWSWRSYSCGLPDPGAETWTQVLWKSRTRS